MQQAKPLILLTNDDGIRAPGLGALHRAVSAIARVEVVAPEEQCSAAGHAISVLKGMNYQRIEMSGGSHGHSLSGMPADCVKLAVMGLLQEKPDLVISGINRGSNVGNNILYSGTVAAAIEGAMLGIPSMAISLAARSNEPVMHFDVAAQWAVRLIPLILEKGLPAGVAMNVNIPNLPPEHIRGVLVTRQGKGMYIDVMEPTLEGDAIKGFCNRGEVMIHSAEGVECDDVAVRDGFVSITPLQYDLTCYPFRQSLHEWLKDRKTFNDIGES